MTVNKTLTHVGGDVGGDFTATRHVFEMLTKNVGVRHTATMWAVTPPRANKNNDLASRTRARAFFYEKSGGAAAEAAPPH
jgi:hypothetical protein